MDRVDYSKNETGEFLDLESMNKEGLGKISGAVKTSFGLEEINKINRNVLEALEEGERVEKIIKIRNIKAIGVLTIGSFFGATMAGVLDFTIFDALYFTNKRLILVGTNVINAPLNYSSIKREDIIGLKFTTRVVKVVKDELGEAKVEVTTSKLKKILCITSLLSILGGAIFGILGIDGLVKISSFFGITVPLSLIYILNDVITNPIKMALKDGKVYSMLIASDDYKKCYEYLSGMAKEIENKE